MDDLTIFLAQLQTLIEQGKFEELESDTIELKPCPSTGQDWSERFKSVNAFLNTRGGLLILGIKEEGRGSERKYVVSGYDASAENKLSEMRQIFSDSEKHPLDLTEYLPPTEIHSFMGNRIAVQRVDAVPAQQRFIFFRGDAFKRQLTGDLKIKQAELDRQVEFLEEIAQARELDPLGKEGVECVDLDKLNEYILQLNRLQKIESLKPSLDEAIPFLTRKRFLIDGRLTLLGGLVCGAHPGDLLGFRAHVHGYVNATSQDSIVVQDKQDMVANVLPLLEQANAYVLRNIQASVTISRGGTVSPQYPESVLRETINNALAHRDYSINKQVVISITPGRHIEITNPGKFRDQLLLNLAPLNQGQTPILRVVPETKPRNPRLADVLRVYRKWEGRGIGMSTLVNLSLDNRLNLPYFKFKSDEVTLVLQAGQLIDARITELFESRDAYIAKKLGSLEEFSDEKKAVLAYLIKSEWANSEGRFCVLLTPDNNHAQAIKVLERAGLISRDSRSTDLYPVYTADRNLHAETFEDELRSRFGNAIDDLPLLWRKVIAVIYRYNSFSSKNVVSAKQASFGLWAAEDGDQSDIRAFDLFYRKIRRVFNQLEEQGFIVREQIRGSKGFGYVLASSLRGTQKALF
ncbi:ATP-binding protein [Polaromonas sp.]|uniref:ATP-binding protein n=1 Tax=Polaromonas sp. TaxID=1869339 RepID=UPI00248909CA|nr:ATP-binding protein [Polaromonas sp.]MDI1273785.1 ATP-binding protein [Polaromonas sp.]